MIASPDRVPVRRSPTSPPVPRSALPPLPPLSLDEFWKRVDP